MNRDYMGLEWVQREIEQTLQQAELALDHFTQRQDLSDIRLCVTYLHQVHGSLQMLDLSLLASLAMTMEQIAQAILHKTLNPSSSRIEVLRRTVAHFPLLLSQAYLPASELKQLIDPWQQELSLAQQTGDSADIDSLTVDQANQADGTNLSLTSTYPTLRVRNKKQMTEVLVGVQQALSGLEKTLEIFMQADAQVSEHATDVFALLEQQLPVCQQLQDDLDLLHLSQLSQVAQVWQQQIEQAIATRTLFSAVQINSITDEFVKLQAVISEWQAGNPIFSWTGLNIQQQALQSARLEAIKNCRLEIQPIKESIAVVRIEYAVVFAQISEQMKMILGSLSVLEVLDCIAWLQSCIEYFNQFTKQRLTEPLPGQFQALTDLIACIDYYLESLVAQQKPTEQMFNMALQAQQVLRFMQQPDSLSENLPTSASIELPPPETVNACTDEFDSIDEDVIDVFIEELGEVQQTLENYFPRWQESPSDMLALKELRRAFHTVKGSGRMVGASIIGETAWAAENLLNRLVERTVPVTPVIVKTMQRAVQVIPQLLEAFQQRKPHTIDLKQLQDDLHALAVMAPLVSNRQKDTDDLSAEELTLNEQASLDEIDQSVTALDSLVVDSIEEDDFVPSSIDESESTAEETLEESFEEPFEEPLLDTTSDTTQAQAAAIHSDLSLTLAESLAIHDNNSDAKQPAEFSDLTLAKVSPEPRDNVLLTIFTEEALSHIAIIEQCLAKSERAVDLDNDLLRALHTLKGSACMAKAAGIVNLVTPLEQLLKVMQMRAYTVSADLQEYLADFVLALRDTLPLLQADPDAQAPEHFVLLARLCGFYQHYFAVDSLDCDLEQLPFEAQATLLSVLTSEELDALHQADALLDIAKKDLPAYREEIEFLCLHLQSIVEKALTKHHIEVANLSEALLGCYQVVLNKNFLDDGWLECLEQAHANLLEMLEAIGARQSVYVDQDLIQQLQSYAQPTNSNSTLDIQPDTAELENPEAQADPASVDQSAAQASDLVSDMPLPSSVENDTETSENTFLSSLPSSVLTDDAELVAIFVEEGADILESIGLLLKEWIADPANLLKAQELQRELHTLKGGARISGLLNFAEFTERVENFYEAISDGRVAFSAELSTFLLGCHDQLLLMVEELKQHKIIEYPEAILAKIPYFLSEEYVVALRSTQVFSSNSISDKDHDQTILFLQSKDSVTANTPPVVKTTSIEPPHRFLFSPDVECLFKPDFDRDIFEIFSEEAHELLEVLDQSLHDWIGSPEEQQFLQSLLRVLHTLKGSARLAGLTQLGDAAHDFETVLGELNEVPDTEFFSQMQQRHDVLEQAVKELKLAYDLGPTAYAAHLSSLNADIKPDASEKENAPPVSPVTAAKSALIELIPEKAEADKKAANQQLFSGENSSAQQQAVVVPFAPPVKGRKIAHLMRQSERATQQEMVKVQGSLLSNLVNLAGETTISTGRIETQVTTFSLTLNELTATIARVTDLLRRLDLETEAHMAYRYENQLSSDDEFDPLEMDRYSMLHQLSRSLAESASDIADLKDTLSNNIRDTESLLMQQSRINARLQEGLMRTQLVPFGRLLPRLRRMVRQLSLELQKQVNLEVVNADGEMDRNVLDRMVAPLEHMLRNSVDHGIEPPAQRLLAGKPAEGRITLHLAREGAEVVLRLSDDGRGMQLDSIKRQAIAQGLMKADAELSENDILQFVFKPGFSTAEKVTQISGRGVGMDVVYSEIKQLGGSMKIHSALGVGTQFTIRLPFTVAISRALMVRVGDDTYAIPLANIEGVVRINPYELMNYYRAHNPPKFNYSGREYRVQYLGAYVQGISTPVLHGLERPVPVLLVRSGDSAVALQVDALIGSREVVVKSLGPQLSAVSGISGATILGDGSVVIILDVVALLRAERAGLAHAADIMYSSAQKRARQTPLVMVVDDSVTVRKVTSRLLERHGLDVIVAKDGVDAMTKLQDTTPDLILLDIEMPRMDGFEVASQVRHNERLQSVPIIMITSRTGEKHRNRAFSLGVNDFMGKPYQETQLVEAMQSILGTEAVKF